MPAHSQSLRLTAFYRDRLQVIRIRAERVATQQWERLDLGDFEATYTDWLGSTTSAVARGQQEAVRLSGAYLTAFLSAELGHRVRNVDIDVGDYAGKSRDGRPLSESFDSPRVGVLVALKDGRDNPGALSAGLERATRMVELDVLHAARSAALDRIAVDDRFDGWQRAVRGTCGACAGVARGLEGGTRFQVHPGCFPAGVEVSGPPAVAASKRWYVGDLVELRFDGGGLLTCTPNHPVLTPRGWVAADQLSERSDVIRSRGEQRGMSSVGPDDHKRPSLIEQVAETLRGAGRVSSVTVPLAPEDFHGDGGTPAEGLNREVDVVWADRLLKAETVSKLPDPVNSGVAPQLFHEPVLCLRCAADRALAGLSHLAALLEGVLAPPRALMGGAGEATVLLGGSLRSGQAIRRSSSTDRDAGLSENPVDREATRRSVPSREGLLRFAGEVETDQLVSVRRYPFRGHVYNLQSSAEQWYTANRTVVHNCQCVSEPVVKGAKDRFPRPTGPAIFAAKSEAEQDEMLGPEAAALVRAGEIELADLVGHSHLDAEGAEDFLTQRPLQSLTP